MKFRRRTEKDTKVIDLNHVTHIPRLRRTTLILSVIIFLLIVGVGILAGALLYSYRSVKSQLFGVDRSHVEMTQYLMSSIDYHTERQKLVKFITTKIHDETYRAHKYNKSVREISSDEAYAIASAIAKYTEIYPSVDPIFALAVARRESFFNRKAKSCEGAMGLWQLLPSTAMSLTNCLGTQVTDSLLRNIDFNARYGIMYLNILLFCFRVPEKALIAWNAGPKWVSKENIPEETVRFVPSVLETYRAYVQEYKTFDVREAMLQEKERKK